MLPALISRLSLRAIACRYRNAVAQGLVEDANALERYGDRTGCWGVPSLHERIRATAEARHLAGHSSAAVVASREPGDRECYLRQAAAR